MDKKVPMVSASAAKEKDGSLIVSLANTSLDKTQEVELHLEGTNAKNISGNILTCKKISDYNDFAHPDVIKEVAFTGAKLKKNVVKAKIPAKSIVVLNIR